MWRPKTWEDLNSAIGVIAEAPDLDFKAELTSNKEIAKDIAAMSIQGGVIAYGVAEDDQAVAKQITPVELHQTPEKLQQIVDSAISPSPIIDIQVITDPTDSAKGVLIISVPPSRLAPHYANTRFPARPGTTTRYLDEREIAAFYEQRRASFASVEETTILAGHMDPVDAPHGIRGIGMLRMVIAPFAPARLSITTVCPSVSESF